MRIACFDAIGIARSANSLGHWDTLYTCISPWSNALARWQSHCPHRGCGLRSCVGVKMEQTGARDRAPSAGSSNKRCPASGLPSPLTSPSRRITARRRAISSCSIASSAELARSKLSQLPLPFQSDDSDQVACLPRHHLTAFLITPALAGCYCDTAGSTTEMGHIRISLSLLTRMPNQCDHSRLLKRARPVISRRRAAPHFLKKPCAVSATAQYNRADQRRCYRVGDSLAP